MKYLNILFKFIKLYKIQFCKDISIIIPNNKGDFDIIFNKLKDNESDEFFLFKIINKKSKKVEIVITLKNNQINTYKL